MKLSDNGSVGIICFDVHRKSEEADTAVHWVHQDTRTPGHQYQCQVQCNTFQFNLDSIIIESK